MCTYVISSLSNATVMSLSTNSPAETCDTLLLLVISVCCHFIYNVFLLQVYKIEGSRRSLTAILVGQVGFRKMTSYSLLLYLLQGLNVIKNVSKITWLTELTPCVCLSVCGANSEFYTLTQLLTHFTVVSIVQAERVGRGRGVYTLDIRISNRLDRLVIHILYLYTLNNYQHGELYI